MYTDLGMSEEAKKKERTRMVVEEVSAPEVEKNDTISSDPLEEIKENAQEIQELVDEVKPQVQSQPTQTQPLNMETSIENDFIKPVSSGPSPLVIIIPGVLLLGGLLGGIIFYQNSLKNKPEVTPTPGSVEVIVPTPEPTASLVASDNLTKYKVKILNGSGISGEATKVKDLLTKAGFVVSTTGNAANYNYTDTIIQAKSSVDASFLTKLSDTLSKTYSVGKNETVVSSVSDDVVVIVGTTKAK